MEREIVKYGKHGTHLRWLDMHTEDRNRDYISICELPKLIKKKSSRAMERRRKKWKPNYGKSWEQKQRR